MKNEAISRCVFFIRSLSFQPLFSDEGDSVSLIGVTRLS